MDKPIIDLEELLEEARDRIEEKIAIEGGTKYEWYYFNSYRLMGFLQRV